MSSKRNIALLLIIALLGMGFTEYIRFHDGKMHVIFCDVGQGDAILIRTPDAKQILFDGGPSNNVLDCLSKHMPFWDRTIELAILSHPHLDHYAGFTSLFERFSVKTFASEALRNDTDSFREMEQKIQKAGTKFQLLSAGDSFVIDSQIRIDILGPKPTFLAATSTNGEIHETGEFASVVALLRFQKFSLLLTGDAQAGQLEADTAGIGTIQVLQVPHHGSRSGLTETLVGEMHPAVSIFSVGKNSYGHPALAIIDLLQKHNSQIFRTDKNGTVSVSTDGLRWQVASD
jgi:competence protein ComEC